MPAITYIAQVSLYWLLLYACYWLLLRRHTFFAWNRAYLLASLLGAFALPLVEYPEAAPPVVYEVPAWAGSEVAVEPMAGFSPPARVETTDQVPDTTWLTWPLALSVVYLAGLLAMGVRLGRHYRRLMRFLGRLEGLDMERYRLYVLPDDAMGSFSFLHHIILNRTDYEHNLDTILSHELVHVRQRHSWDILLVEALRVLFWFNPVLILYKRSLQQVHEYLADREVCACDAPRDGYAAFMLAYALRGSAEPLVNSFFKSSLLKDRIMMLYKTRNSNWSLGRYAVVASFTLLVAGVISGFQPRNDEQKENLPEPLVQVEGIVIDTDGKRLEGVKVLIRDQEDTNRRLVLATTDAEGAYTVDVPVGRDLIFDRKDYKPVSVEIKGYLVVNATLAGAKSNIPSTTEVSSSLESRKAERKWDDFGKLIPRFYDDIAPKKRQEPEELKLYLLGSEDTTRIDNKDSSNTVIDRQIGVNAQVDSLIGLKFRKPNDGNTPSMILKLALRGKLTDQKRPLLVIDGVPQPIDITEATLKTISTDDISQMKVYEGGSFVNEKYGVRAVNGVVEITTKQGEKMPLGIKK